VPLRLRPYRVDDEGDALAAHEALRADEFHFLLGWDPSMPWMDFLIALENQRLGRNLTDEQVRAVQLVADVDGEFVGRASIRFSLNDFLALRGGHIGYAVVPPHRRRGYATEILRQALVVIRAEGVNRVLVTCEDSNIGSLEVIERVGGVLESIVPLEEGGPSLSRYWIE
jgi:predicted acetyltransferase